MFRYSQKSNGHNDWRDLLEVELYACRAACSGLPTRQVIDLDGPHPTVKLVLSSPRAEQVILIGRATSVPFTAVPSGPQRHPRTTPRRP
jgi:hypothetical protein